MTFSTRSVRSFSVELDNRNAAEYLKSTNAERSKTLESLGQSMQLWLAYPPGNIRNRISC
jgi:muconolactone delta-isomerase